MAGRFLSTPFWLAVLLLARRDWSLTRPLWLVLISGIGLVGLFSPDPPVFSGPLYGTGNRPLVYPNQISNERAFFYQQTGLRAMQRRDFSFQNASSQKREVLVYSKLGIPAFTAPRNAHVIDFFALADPLLARLPSLDLVNQPPLKMGHHPRFLPAGYIQALETGENHLRDPALAVYYEQLRLITRGPIWSRARFGAIWRMHFGRWDAEIDHDFYRNPTQIRVNASEVPALPDLAAPWYAAVNVLFSAQGLTILLEGIAYPETVELGFYRGGEYEVILMKDGEAVERHPVDLEYGEDGRQQVVAISLSPAARAVGITEVQVMPMALRHWQVLGFLRFQ
jgi:arabinofuranosyltransferase